MNLKIENARGACCHGFSVMEEAKSVMASRIKALRRKCLCTNCYGHVLNIYIKDACYKISCLKNTMDVAMEIRELAKESP